MSAAIRFTLVPSPVLALCMAVLHGVAAGCAVAAVPGVAGWLLGSGFVALGVAAAWSRALLRSRASVRAIEISGTALSVELASGEKLAVEAAERRYVSRLAVSIPLRRPRRTVLITADMMSRDEFRRLRIWALWGRLPGVAAAQLPA